MNICLMPLRIAREDVQGLVVTAPCIGSPDRTFAVAKVRSAVWLKGSLNSGLRNIEDIFSIPVHSLFRSRSREKENIATFRRWITNWLTGIHGPFSMSKWS